MMRGSFAALGCALGMTCVSSPPRSEETVAMHAPVDVAPTVSLAQPAVALSTDSGGAFWEPDGTGHAVAVLRRDAPNLRYGAMDRMACEAELSRRNVSFVHADAPPGTVLAPVRLHGPLSGGVTIHSMLPASQRDRAEMEIFDCRLVLALDDFSVALAKRGIVEMIHLSAFRPRSQHGCTPKYDGQQHCGALAVDIASFKRADGSTLNVEHDFHGHIGSPTCTVTPRPNELWTIVCDAADRGTFNVMLTPNFNAQHFNHIHVEITPDAGWMLVH